MVVVFGVWAHVRSRVGAVGVSSGYPFCGRNDRPTDLRRRNHRCRGHIIRVPVLGIGSKAFWRRTAPSGIQADAFGSTGRARRHTTIEYYSHSVHRPLLAVMLVWHPRSCGDGGHRPHALRYGCYVRASMLHYRQRFTRRRRSP